MENKTIVDEPKKYCIPGDPCLNYKTLGSTGRVGVLEHRYTSLCDTSLCSTPYWYSISSWSCKIGNFESWKIRLLARSSSNAPFADMLHPTGTSIRLIVVTIVGHRLVISGMKHYATPGII